MILTDAVPSKRRDPVTENTLRGVTEDPSSKAVAKCSRDGIRSCKVMEEDFSACDSEPYGEVERAVGTKTRTRHNAERGLRAPSRNPNGNILADMNVAGG